MNKTQNKLMAQVLMPYMEELAKNDAELAEAMKKQNKSEEELIEYVIYMTTHGENKSVLVDGNEVLALATRYYKDDAIVMPSMSTKAKPAPKAAEPAKEEPKKAEPKKSKPKKQEPLVMDLFADM